MADKFQAVVIGGGPGGYVCAIRLAQLGFKTACIESRGSLGGTCLNIGCIPSKSLLNLSEEFHKVQNLSNKGIEIDEVKLNLSKMMKSKDKAVTILTKGVEFLFKKNKVTYLKGTGTLRSKNEISIKDMLLSENDNPPELIISFFDSQKGIEKISCFSNAGGSWGKPETSISAKKLYIKFNKKFQTRRGRINCSMQDDGLWKWFGLQFTFNEN